MLLLLEGKQRTTATTTNLFGGVPIPAIPEMTRLFIQGLAGTMYYYFYSPLKVAEI